MENKVKSLEEGMERIEQIIQELNKNEVPLDRALELYEEGISLVRTCNKLLDATEKKMKILLEDHEGEITLETYNLKMEV